MTLVSLTIKPSPSIDDAAKTDIIDLSSYRHQASRPVDPSWKRHFKTYHVDYIIVAVLVVIGAYLTLRNISGYPAWYEDEGTYEAQAWAIQTRGELAHYTYWYDHPPVGWIQLAFWSALTGALSRHTFETILAGREYMAVCRVAAVALLYVLARRLDMRRGFAVLAAVIFILSPLAALYGRFVLLDNVAVPWLLAAFALVLSPRRSLLAVIAGALCFAVTVLSKETFVVFGLPLGLMVLKHYWRASNRTVCYIVFFATAGIMTGFYVLSAIYKGELLPGPGHVSLVGALEWQLGGRTSNGSVFDPASDARNLVNTWLDLDPYLLVGGIGAIIPAVIRGRAQHCFIALAMVLVVLVGIQTSYLPYPYVIALLPLAALLIALGADNLWPSMDTFRKRGWLKRSLGVVDIVVVVATAFGFASTGGSTHWQDQTQTMLTADASAYQKAAVDWVGTHVPHQAQVVTESKLWLDLRNRGFDAPEVIWLYKLDTDPAVSNKLGGGQNIDYVVVSKVVLLSKDNTSYPTLLKVAANSVPIASFGTGDDQILIMRQNGAKH